jgi:uncharacterized protein YggT (Ycf19 family)
MTPSQSLITHWYFHIPNLIMAALIYMLIGRYVLSLIFGWTSDNVIVRVISAVTDPVLKVVGAITPKIVPAGLLILFSVVWLFVARVALFLGLVMLGLRPNASL